jgi:hypothetical protein
MNTEQHGALERVRDTCAVLRTFMHTENTGAPPWFGMTPTDSSPAN